MKLFFFGTLMDPDRFKAVTGHDLHGVPAVIHGYKRVYARGASFPVLVEATGADSVEGIVIETDDEQMIARLDRYESGLYFAQMKPVQFGDDSWAEARVYLADWTKLKPTDMEWTLENWRH